MRSFAASMALIAMATAGCADNGNGMGAQSIDTTTESTRYPIPPELANLDPCSLVQQNEVDEITGVGGLKPERDDNTDPEFADMDACTWGTPGGSTSQGSMGVVTWIREPREQVADELSLRMAQRLGRPADINESDPDSCTAFAFYSQNRRVTVLISPSDEKLAINPPVRDVDTVCDRSMDLMATIFQRVPWE